MKNTSLIAGVFARVRAWLHYALSMESLQGEMSLEPFDSRPVVTHRRSKHWYARYQRCMARTGKRRAKRGAKKGLRA